jgi:hypothetical protein
LFFCGGGEGNNKNATQFETPRKLTPLEQNSLFDRYVAVKEVFCIGKDEIKEKYREECVLPGSIRSEDGRGLKGQKGQKSRAFIYFSD